MHKVLKQMKRRGIDLSTLHALEVFGYTGELHTIYYAPYVSSLEIWEIDPRYEERLKRNLPRAKVRIVDSYEEIKLTPDRYDLVVVDNPMQNHGNHSEHFDLFPHIYRVCLSPTIVVLNTIPKIDDADQVDYPNLFNEVHLARHRAFYGTDHAEKISLSTIAGTYRRLAAADGFHVEWSFFVKRTSVYYFVSKIVRSASRPSDPHARPGSDILKAPPLHQDEAEVTC